MENLEITRTEFYEALEGLKHVHTQEALDEQTKIVFSARERLLEIDPEFKASYEARRQASKMRAERRRAEHRAMQDGLDAEVSLIRANAESIINTGRKTDFALNRKFKTRTLEEARAG